jgi:IS30 family transposase
MASNRKELLLFTRIRHTTNSNIVTLVERHSRYVMLAKVPNRETQTN